MAYLKDQVKQLENNTSVILKNVKARFLVKKPVEISTKVFGLTCPSRNFVIHRHPSDNVTFTVFANSRWVNVTGVKSFGFVEYCAKEFCEKFELEYEEDSIIVDCTTAIGSLNNVERRDLTLMSIEYNRLQQRDNLPYIISARTKTFPSLLFRPRVGACTSIDEVEEDIPIARPSLTLFTTGKFVILGGRSQEEILATFSAVTRFMLILGWRPFQFDNTLAVKLVEEWDEREKKGKDTFQCRLESRDSVSKELKNAPFIDPKMWIKKQMSEETEDDQYDRWALEKSAVELDYFTINQMKKEISDECTMGTTPQTTPPSMENPPPLPNPTSTSPLPPTSVCPPIIIKIKRSPSPEMEPPPPGEEMEEVTGKRKKRSGGPAPKRVKNKRKKEEQVATTNSNSAPSFVDLCANTVDLPLEKQEKEM